MSSQQVGSLYVTVGVDGDAAILQAKRLNGELYKISKTMKQIGDRTNFTAVTAQLQRIELQAQKTGKAVKDASTGAGGNAGSADMAKLQSEALAINRVFDQTRAAQNASAIAAQKAAAEQVKAAAAVTAAEQKAATAAQAAASQQVKAAEAATAKEIDLAHRLARARENDMMKAAYAANKSYDAEVKAAEKAAAKEIVLANAVSSRRKVAMQRAAADSASGFAALASGNPAYALANFAQAGVKASGAIAGIGVASTAATVGVIALAAAVPVLGIALTGIGGVLAKAGLEQAANVELLRIQYEGLLGTAQKARAEVDYVLQLGTKSLVPTADLLDANRLLLSFGATNTAMRRQMLEFMSAFASVTGASGMQLNNLSYAMGQIVSVGKVNAIDLRQLATAGISTASIYREVAKQQKISVQEAKSWLSQGKLTAEVVLPAILARTQKLEEAQKKARESARGMLLNIKDIANVKMGQAFDDLLASLKPAIKWVQSFVQSFDFQYIADAWENVVGYFSEGFETIGGDARSTAKDISSAIAKAVNIVGFAAVQIAKMIVVVYNTLMTVWNIAWAGIQGAVSVILKSISVVTGAAGAIPGPWQQAMKDVSTSTDAMAASAVDGMAIAGNAIIQNAGAVVNSVASIYASMPTFQDLGTQARGDIDFSYTQYAAYAPAKKPKYPKPIALPTGGATSGGSSGESKALTAAKKLLEVWKELTEQSIKGRDALREAFIIPFASKQTGATTEAFKQFTSGEVDTVVSQYKEIRQALEDFYAVAEGKGAKGAKAQRRGTIAWLKAQTGELVRLASERAAIVKQIADREEAYNLEIEKIDARRETLATQMAERQKKVAEQFDDYYTATSATQGTFIKGALSVAQSALDAATSAYEKAQSKLDDLISARDSFLDSLREMAFSFVNDLSKVNEEITRFTRLDSVGSFSSVTEQVASTQSFTAGLKARLAALKDFASNVRALIASGLDQGVVQQILTSGPEQGGAIAAALAGASASEIADINAVQAELASTITGMQTDASAAWYDAGIAAQQAFTAPLKAAMDAAATQVRVLEEQKALALGILEAWNADQTALLDAEAEAAKVRYDTDTKNLKTALDVNALAAETIALGIDKRLKGLPTTAYASGLSTIQGLIDGLSDDAKLKELKAAAAAMANKVKDTVNSVLGVNSPSTVMISTGQDVGRGLAIGMGLSTPLVAAAATGMAIAAVGTVGGDGASAEPGGTLVKVYLSDKELTQLVGSEITVYDNSNRDLAVAGRRL